MRLIHKSASCGRPAVANGRPKNGLRAKLCKTGMHLLGNSLLTSLLAGVGIRPGPCIWGSYRQLVESMRVDKYYAIPLAERDKLDFFLVIKPGNKALKGSDFQFAVLHAGGWTPLPVSAEGYMRLVPNLRLLAEDAAVVSIVPRGERVEFAHGLNGLIPDGLQWSYNALMGSVSQANHVIGQMTGVMRVFYPLLTRVILKFDVPAQLTISSRAGIRRLATDACLEIHLMHDLRLQRENPQVVVTARPWAAELDE